MKTNEPLPQLYVKDLVLRDFRNYEDQHVEFSTGFNSIYGSNAQGKSNLLEALFLFVSGRSFRTKQLSELLRHGAERYFLQLTFVKQGFTHELRMLGDGRTRRILHNGKPLSSLRSLMGLCPGVFSGAGDTSLIKGPPAIRRHFMDLQLSQADPLYLHHLMRYQRALKQRNALLKQRIEASLDAWEEQLANSASYLVAQRGAVVVDLALSAARIHEQLAEDSGDLSLTYKGCSGSIDELLVQYRSHRPRELILGQTLLGPHRDDLIITINGRQASSFASEGQLRSCVAALRLAEWEGLRDRLNELPLMCIDDASNSLDSSRRNYLFDFLSSSAAQVFVTSPEAIPANSFGRQLNVRAGQVSVSALPVT